MYQRLSGGEDGIGKFWIHGSATCEHCQRPEIMVVEYKTIKLDDYIKFAPSLILKQKIIGTGRSRKLVKRRLGIECGCYSKLHRQATYINAGKQAKQAA